MNKEMKRRKKRKERDMRWVQKSPLLLEKDSHRGKKIFGLSKPNTAFWCHETDERPLISKIYHEHLYGAMEDEN